MNTFIRVLGIALIVLGISIILGGLMMANDRDGKEQGLVGLSFGVVGAILFLLARRSRNDREG